MKHSFSLCLFGRVGLRSDMFSSTISSCQSVKHIHFVPAVFQRETPYQTHFFNLPNNRPKMDTKKRPLSRDFPCILASPKAGAKNRQLLESLVPTFRPLQHFTNRNAIAGSWDKYLDILNTNADLTCMIKKRASATGPESMETH